MGTQVSEVKKILRQQMREAMAEMTEQEKAWSDQELVSAFLAHPKLDEANTVMLYYGVGQEIATRPCWTRARPSACPNVCRSTSWRPGSFRAWTSWSRTPTASPPRRTPAPCWSGRRST